MRALTVLPDGSRAESVEDSNVLESLRRHGTILTSPCGGEGTCGKCRIQIEEGSVNAPTPQERGLLGNALGEGDRLACQTIAQSDATVRIPTSSRVPNVRVLTGGTPREVPFFPNVRRRSFTWERDGLADAESLVDAVADLLDARADLRVDLPVVRELATGLEYGETYEATIIGDRLVAVAPEAADADPLGVALDIGTTTVVAQVVNLSTGEVVGTDSRVNDQSRFGGDVIARINHCFTEDHGLDELKDAVLSTIKECIAASGVDPSQVYEAVAVGNTTMMHLLAGISPESLGQLPYTPVMRAGVDVPAAYFPMPFSDTASVHLMAGIAGYVGADTVAAMLAAGFDEPYEGVRLLADIGTNCELVLQRGDEVVACSTPAGPAFEGARLEHGMLAGPGAIERVTVGDTCEIRVVGRADPSGICGSGVVDVTAQLLEAGVIEITGRLTDAEDAPASLPDDIRDRIGSTEYGPIFVVARREDGETVHVTQRDIRETQLAKAAVRTGIDTLLHSMDIPATDIDELLVAGGFGSYLNTANARRLGMIPDIDDEKIKYIGNAAIVGARLALISAEMRARGEALSRRVKHVQVALLPSFQDRFAEAMLFE